MNFSQKNPFYLLAVWVENKLRNKLGTGWVHLGSQHDWRRAAENAALRRRVNRVLSDKEKLRRAMTPAPPSPRNNRSV